MDANISPNITASPANVPAAVAPHSDKLHKPEKPVRPAIAEQEQKQTAFNAFLFQQRAARLINTRQARVVDCDAFKLPAEVVDYIAEAKYYDQLKTLESDVDAVAKAKKLDMEEMVVQPSPKVKTMLLLHVYNVHYNQANPFTLSRDDVKVPAWGLRIQGRLILGKGSASDSEVMATIQPHVKMTHFIRKVEIAFNKEQVDYADIEWCKDTSSHGQKEEDKDGIEIIREGNRELDLAIAIHINYSPRQFRVKPELQALIGTRQCTRMQAISAFWEYVKANRLQNQQDRQVIDCNRELKALAGQDSILFSSLLKRFNEWLEEPEPHRITYKLNMTREFHAGEKLFKVPVEVEEPNYLYFMHYLGNSDQEFVHRESTESKEGGTIARKKASKSEEKIRKYNSRLVNYIDKVRHSIHRLKFFECYGEEPLRFIQNFMLQQNSLVRMLQDEEGEAQTGSSTKEGMEKAVEKYLAETEKKPSMAATTKTEESGRIVKS